MTWRRNLFLRTMLLLFSLSIAFCGLNHLTSALSFWCPLYRLYGLIKMITAVTFAVVLIAIVRNMARQDGFHTIADYIPQLAWTARADGHIFWYNRRWYEYTGKTELEMEGWGWQSVHDPEELPKVLERWRKSIASGEPFDMVFPLCGSDGRFRPFLTRVWPLKDARGRVTQWFGTNTDITDERKTAKEFARSNEELEQFAYVASHNLQEPLRTISSYAQLIETKCGDKIDEDSRVFITYLVDGATRMQELVDDLLAYAKVNSKSNPLERTELSVSLCDAMLSLRHTILESGAEITHGELPAVLADGSQMTQLFVNLLSNSIKFRADATVPKIHVSAAIVDGVAAVSIEDNGIGIDPKFYGRVFQLFQRLHNRTKYSGTGMGLAICKKIVEHHGGTIKVNSATGRGSIFSFVLPLYKADQNDGTRQAGEG